MGLEKDDSTAIGSLATSFSSMCAKLCCSSESRSCREPQMWAFLVH